MFDMNRANDRYIFYVERFHRFDNELQSNSELLHVTGFLRVIYPILNASVILERNETQLARNEKRLERNETRIARNETRGGNLLLSGTVVWFRNSLRTFSFFINIIINGPQCKLLNFQ